MGNRAEGVIQEAPLPALPPALERAGCAVAVVERQIAVLDPDGVLLERAPRKHLAWLWLASTHALIERQAEALGLRQQLHAEQALVRLWRPDQDAEGAPWRTFEGALALLAALAIGAIGSDLLNHQIGKARLQDNRQVDQFGS